MKLQTSMLIFGAAFFLSASELVQNGSFSNGLEHWQVPKEGSDPYTASELDKTVSADSGSSSVKLIRNDAQGVAWRPYVIQRNIRLKPDTQYEISCYIRGRNIAVQPKSGAYIAVTVGNKTLHYGSKGLWKYDTGTFDWTEVRHRFNSRYFGGTDAIVALGIRDSTGTAWFDSISLKEVGKEPAKVSFQADLFPFNFLKEAPFGICENLPGTLNLRGKGNGKYTGKNAVMTLDIPKYLTLEGVSETHAALRNGKRDLIAQNVTESPVKRNGEDYRRYRIAFEKQFNVWFGQSWYTQRLFLNAAAGSAGKKSPIYWTLKIGEEEQPEQSGMIEVLPPVKTGFRPCGRFGFMISQSGAVHSPFPELGRKMTAFWHTLVKQPLKLNSINEKPDPAYRNGIMLGGNYIMFPYQDSRKALEQYRKKAPADMDSEGKHTHYTANWYQLDDPEKLFETYLRNSIREWRRTNPEVKVAIWDFEPHARGMDEAGRARFAKKMNLPSVPSIAEITRKYKQQWLDYMIRLHAEYIAKVAKIFREEAPGTEFWLCSDNLHDPGTGRERVAAWCAVDAALSDSAIDLHMHMPYYTGTKYFDDVKYSIESLKKPFFPLNDPAETSLSFFRQYTPEKLKQNIIATAALGGAGFGLWPNDTFSGHYFHCIASAYELISGCEDFYADGKRVESQFAFTPENTISKEVTSGNGGKLMLHYPDFSRKLRCLAHEKDGRFVFTLFNYDEKEPVILKVAGRGMKFLVKIPSNGVEVVHSYKLPEQEPLTAEIRSMQAKNTAGDLFREVKSREASIVWGASAKGSPVLRISNGKLNAEMDALGTCELIALSDAGGRELLSGGHIGKLMLYDAKQPKIQFMLKDMKVNGRNPVVVSTATVPAYEGANPEQNPLMDLRIARSFELDGNTILVRFRFSNPTSHMMNFGFRVNNYPQPGLRFGKKNLTISLGTEKVTQNSGLDNLFLRKNVKIGFLPHGKSRLWDGGPVVISAQDKVLKDSMAFFPGPGFEGVYCWNANSKTPMMTVEFLSGGVSLAPGAEREFHYRIEVGK